MSAQWFGETVGESAEERHERHLQAIMAVLRPYVEPGLREVAEECLAAAETGI